MLKQTSSPVQQQKYTLWKREHSISTQSQSKISTKKTKFTCNMQLCLQPTKEKKSGISPKKNSQRKQTKKSESGLLKLEKVSKSTVLLTFVDNVVSWTWKSCRRYFANFALLIGAPITQWMTDTMMLIQCLDCFRHPILWVSLNLTNFY